MKRNELLKKINSYRANNDIGSAIKLLCELIEMNNSNNADLINVLIETFQLYGYISNEKTKKFGGMFPSNSNSIRFNSYGGLYLKHLNYGQLSLLEKISNVKKIFISAPTSFGKTSIVLEYIYRNNMSLNNIIFIAPTHSLIEEIYIKFLKINKNISHKYNITVGTKKYNGRTVRILTPERFLTYYETMKINNIDLIIMDEAHKIDTNNTEREDVDLINFLPSNIANDEDVSNNREVKFRKVLQLLGECNKKVVLLSPYTFRKDLSMEKYFEIYNVSDLNRNISYVSHKYHDLSKVVDFNKTFQQNELTKNYNSIAKKVVKILNEIKDEQNVIYINYPSFARRFFDEMKNKNILLNADFENYRYIKFLDHLEKNYLVDGIQEWYIIEALKMGIGLYVSSMPRYLKREIVYLFNQKIIKTLIVTTAFIEGVNSSAKNIIVSSGSVGANKPLNSLTLLNIVGRAGRFGENYIGNVYFIKNDTYNKVVNNINCGTKLYHPNYLKNKTSNKRSDYEIEMIDEQYLNNTELERKQLIKKVLTDNNYDYNELASVSIAVPISWKVKLLHYFSHNEDAYKIKTIINNLADDNNDMFIDSMKQIFEILKEVIFKETYLPNYNYVDMFTKSGFFLWGKLYQIHKNSSFKSILISNKRYIEKIKLEMDQSLIDYTKTWVNSYYTKNVFDDSKLYEKTFKFISDIIDYKIPYYINFFLAIFKYYVEKENIVFDEVEENILTLEEIVEKISNNFIDDNLTKYYDYGFPKFLIDKLEKIEVNILSADIDSINEFDDFEKIILKEYVEIMKDI